MLVTKVLNAFLAGHAHGEERWVKCSDRLPEKGIKVLTLSEAGYMDVMAYDCETEYHSNFYSERISHWMPLPAPPKPDDNA